MITKEQLKINSVYIQKHSSLKYKLLCIGETEVFYSMTSFDQFEENVHITAYGFDWIDSFLRHKILCGDSDGANLALELFKKIESLEKNIEKTECE